MLGSDSEHLLVHLSCIAMSIWLLSNGHCYWSSSLHSLPAKCKQPRLAWHLCSVEVT